MLGDYMKKTFKAILIALLIIVAVSPVSRAFSSFGSRGEEVVMIQQRLSELGYYTGSIDGIYGSATKAAVTAFQKDNGLAADGIAGQKTLTALKVYESTGSTPASSDYLLLARLISAEARGESYIGQVAVGAVVLNRVDHPSFPDSVAVVIYQSGAFSCINDGQFDEAVSDSAYAAARDALNGMDPSGGAIYYFNPDKATNKWIWSRPVITTIGNHIFCA